MQNEHALAKASTATGPHPPPSTSAGLPLKGLRVIEMGGIGPSPHAAMILADWGADVVRVQRIGFDAISPAALTRGMRIVELNLKDQRHVKSLLELVAKSDVLIEGFRPGAMERLGLGPEQCRQVNPRLIYARATGWGQTGPNSLTAGHDINYLAVAGALGTIGDPDLPPPPPLNLVGDYGAGSMMVVSAVLASLHARAKTDHGQVIDVAMVDGVSVLMQAVWGMAAEGQWDDFRGNNLLDGGAPFYRTYRCKDDRFVAVGCIEPKFYASMIDALGVDVDVDRQFEKADWPRLREMLAEKFATRERDDWARTFSGTDACVTPVLSLDEAASNAHMQARNAIITRADGLPQAGTGPKFSLLDGAPRNDVGTFERVDEVTAQWKTEKELSDD